VFLVAPAAAVTARYFIRISATMAKMARIPPNTRSQITR
jgi:hypothetical protein